MNSSAVKRVLKFGMVGGSGVFVNMGVFWLLGKFAGLSVEFASPIAIVSAITTNFLLNYHWTWGDRALGTIKHLGKGYLKFFSASAVTAFLFNYVPLLIMVKVFGWNKELSNFIGIGFASVVNFAVSHLWTFRGKKRS